MGTFKFSWSHPAEEVYVTGTFDNWTKSEKLEKVGDVFEKTVTLPDASKKIYYKFVVDNNWITDHTAPQEPDHEGNVNNFLTPEQITKADSSAAIMNTVTPDATTAALAKDVPLEDEPKATPSDVPGGFPITPANELDKPIGINPLPATDGGVNPIDLKPGEPIPPHLAGGDLNKHVKLDKESYEKSDALPGLETTLPPAAGGLIPESSLPIVGPNSVQTALIGGVTPQSTTAALAGQVPLEPKVPDVVKESQEQAKAEPEASAVPEEVKEKAAVEAELLQKVSEAPSTSEGLAGFGTQKSENTSTIVATATTAAAVVTAAALAAKDTIIGKAAPVVDQATVAASDAAAKLPEPVKQSLPVSVQEAIGTQAKEEVREEVSPEVPQPVKESIAEAGEAPEAAANTAAVEEKKEVEAELLKEVKPVPATDDSKAETAKEEVKGVAKEVKEDAKELKEEAKAEVKDEPKDKPAVVANGGEANGAGVTAATAKDAAAPAPAPATAAAATTTPAATSSSKPAATTPAAGTASAEKKKKNRLSAFFHKLKPKKADN